MKTVTFMSVLVIAIAATSSAFAASGVNTMETPKGLRDPHKSALINQHHILVGSGEVIKNCAQHRSF